MHLKLRLRLVDCVAQVKSCACMPLSAIQAQYSAASLCFATIISLLVAAGSKRHSMLTPAQELGRQLSAIQHRNDGRQDYNASAGHAGEQPDPQLEAQPQAATAVKRRRRRASFAAAATSRAAGSRDAYAAADASHPQRAAANTCAERKAGPEADAQTQAQPVVQRKRGRPRKADTQALTGRTTAAASAFEAQSSAVLRAAPSVGRGRADSSGAASDSDASIVVLPSGQQQRQQRRQQASQASQAKGPRESTSSRVSRRGPSKSADHDHEAAAGSAASDVHAGGASDARYPSRKHKAPVRFHNEFGLSAGRQHSQELEGCQRCKCTCSCWRLARKREGNLNLRLDSQCASYQTSQNPSNARLLQRKYFKIGGPASLWRRRGGSAYCLRFPAGMATMVATSSGSPTHLPGCGSCLCRCGSVVWRWRWLVFGRVSSV